MPDPAARTWRPLPFEQAVDFFKSKVPLTSAQAERLGAQARERAFVVGGLASQDMVASVMTAVQRAVASGTTIEQFRKDIRSVIESEGWTGPKDWRVQTIFRTNVQSAYGAGKWAQFEQAGDALQVAVYDAVGDGRTRPSHQAMDGKAFAKTDPIWDTWWPPNGFNCRCTVRMMSRAEAKARGIQVEDGAGILRGEAVSIGPGRDLVIRPDPGFTSNPGKDFLAGLVAAAMKPSNFTPDANLRRPSDFGLPDTLDALPQAMRFPLAEEDLLPKGITEGAAQEAMRMRLGMGADETVVVRPDVRGDPVLFTRATVQKMGSGDRRRWAALAPDVTAQPSEIWLTTGKDSAGNEVQRRRYIKYFEARAGHSTEGLLAIVEFEGGVWKELSVHPKGADIANQRRGELLYARGLD